MRVEPYSESKEKEWNEFVEKSRNATFLFNRNYMDYHKDRFCDASLLLYKDKKLIGLFPASWNKDEKEITSHEGLTYGGLLTLCDAKTTEVIEMFDAITAYYRNINAKRIIVKPVPYIYTSYPAEEQLYAMYRLSAKLTSRSLSSAIRLSNPLPLQTLRRRGVKKAEKLSLTIEEVFCESKELADFWTILTEVLETKHNTHPVHSITEINRLKHLFDRQILCYVVKLNNNVVAGCIVFNCSEVCHIQYISANSEGRNCGALDFLFSKLIERAKEEDKQYLDFGVSTEHGGQWLNEGLIFQKEGFGGRGVCYDVYTIDL